MFCLDDTGHITRLTLSLPLSHICDDQIECTCATRWSLYVYLEALQMHMSAR